MRTSTFKRNWMLHYIQPEYLYLPRKSGQPEPESCEITFTYNIYKRFDAQDEPWVTQINQLTGYLFKDGILIKDKLNNNRGSTFIIKKKGDYYFIPYLQYKGSFIPENRKFKIRIQEIKDKTIFVYGIDMARTNLTFMSEEGGTETIQQLRSFIGTNFSVDEERGWYTWDEIRIPDLLMLKCKEGESTIIQGRKKYYMVGSGDKHFTVDEASGEHYDTYCGDWHLDWQYRYAEYVNQSFGNETDILCKTFNSDFNYSANYFHYVAYSYDDMYKSDNPPVYPIPFPGGGGKHYLSTTFCCLEGDGIPPGPSAPEPNPDPISDKIWYHNLYCDQHICYIPKIGGKYSLSEPIFDGGYLYSLHSIRISTIGTDQYISTGTPIRRGKGPFSLLFSFIIQKRNPYSTEEPPIDLSVQESGICRLNIDTDFEKSEFVEWLTYEGMEPVVATNDFEGYTRALRVDGRIMYDPLVDNYGRTPPRDTYKRTGRHNREDLVEGNISDELWDERKPAGYVETVIPFLYNNPRNFDYNDFLRYQSSNPVNLPYENVYIDELYSNQMIFFHTACNHDYMSIQNIYEVEQAEDILLNGEERILGEEYRAAGGVYVNGECIIYP